MVTYEFVVEMLDYYEGCAGDPDIIDPVPFETLEDAEKFARAFASPDEPTPWRICLRRDRGNEAEGLIERHYAYPDEHGKLPERMESGHGFNDGPLVPKRFQDLVFPIMEREG